MARNDERFSATLFDGVAKLNDGTLDIKLQGAQCSLGYTHALTSSLKLGFSTIVFPGLQMANWKALVSKTWADSNLSGYLSQEPQGGGASPPYHCLCALNDKAWLRVPRTRTTCFRCSRLL